MEKKELKKEGRLAKKELRHAVRGGRSSVREAKRLAKSTDKMLAEDKKPGRLSRFASAVKGRVKRLFGRSSGGQELTPEEEAMLEAGLNGEDQDQLSPEDEALLEAGLKEAGPDQLSPEDEALLEAELKEAGPDQLSPEEEAMLKTLNDDQEAKALAARLPSVPKTPLPTAAPAPAAQKAKPARRRILAQ